MNRIMLTILKTKTSYNSYFLFILDRMDETNIVANLTAFRDISTLAYREKKLFPQDNCYL